MLDLRLYGPSGDHVTYDLEPEGGAFTADSKYFMVNFQDNNGYALFDVAAKKYVSMAGYGNISMTMDASDKDDMVDIRQGWGSSPSTPAYGLYLPDQVASFTVGGTYYFITANEGDTRDSKDLIGAAGDFEGEEIRMKDLPATCGNACADGKAGDMGRILTTPFMPSDYSANACGTQLCEAWALDRASRSDFDCIYYQADYGGKKDALGNTAHPECGYADTLVYVIDKMNKADGSTYGTRPTSGGFFPNAKTRGQQTVKPWYNYSIPGWFGGASEEDPAVTGPAECQMKCKAHAAANPSNGCDHFSYEFEDGYHECLLKKAHSTTHCHLYSPWIQHWADGGDQYWEGYSGPATCPEGSATATGKAPYTTERFTTNPGDGAPGGATAIGTRSFTIFSWSGNAGDRLVQVTQTPQSLLSLATAAPR